MKYKATYDSYIFEISPGIWSKPYPYWWFSTGKDGTLYWDPPWKIPLG